MNEPDETDDVDGVRERETGEPRAGERQTRLAAPTDPVPVESAEQFETLVSEHSPVLVSFYADWCGPCALLEPTIEDVAARTTATVATVDVDASDDLVQRYDVRGVPTLFLFVDGELDERLVGVQDATTLRGVIGLRA